MPAFNCAAVAAAALPQRLPDPDPDPCDAEKAATHRLDMMTSAEQMQAALIYCSCAHICQQTPGFHAGNAPELAAWQLATGIPDSQLACVCGLRYVQQVLEVVQGAAEATSAALVKGIRAGGLAPSDQLSVYTASAPVRHGRNTFRIAGRLLRMVNSRSITAVERVSEEGAKKLSECWSVAMVQVGSPPPLCVYACVLYACVCVGGSWRAMGSVCASFGQLHPSHAHTRTRAHGHTYASHPPLPPPPPHTQFAWSACAVYHCAGLLPGALQQHMGISCAPLLSDILGGVQGELHNLHHHLELLCWSLQTLRDQLAQAKNGTASAAPTPGLDKFMQQLLSRGGARILQVA